MIGADFLIDFEQKFRTAAVATGVIEKHCLIGVNKTDLAEKAKNVPLGKIAFVNIFPDFDMSGTDNDQLGDQVDLLFFFVQKSDRKSPEQLLQVMNNSLNALFRFRAHILESDAYTSCDWIQKLDWPTAKIAPESNLYEMSGWMLSIKTRII